MVVYAIQVVLAVFVYVNQVLLVNSVTQWLNQLIHAIQIR
jgi:hypothetical protein